MGFTKFPDKKVLKETMASRTKEAPNRLPGRPRDEKAEDRILAVTLRILREDGYMRMTIDAVAAEAGVSKPTIYRRWSSKADLATAALRTLQLAEPQIDTGSGLGDLTRALENFCHSLMRPHGMSLIGTVIAEESHTPELIHRFRERIVVPRRAMLRAVLEKAESRGELKSGVDLDCTVNMLIGAFYARYLAESKIPSRFSRQLAETIWAGIGD